MTDVRGNPTSHSYFSQRLKLHFLDWGNADKPHVILVHGVQDHCHNWDWTAGHLARDFHVIAPDLRGHGDSEWCRGTGYNMLDYIYDIAQLIDQQELEQVHLVGHSMGGTIASLYAGVYPEKVASLTSVEGVGFWRNEEQADIKSFTRVRDWIDTIRSQAGRIPRRYDSLEDAFARMQTSNPHLSEDRARHLTIHGSNKNEDSTYSWKFDNYTHTGALSALREEDMASIWSNVQAPVLLINATDGFAHRIGQDETEACFQRVEQEVIDDAGHWLHHDQFDQFITMLESFLKAN